MGVAVKIADLARLGHVTRARITQIMNLLMLAPDIQEAIHTGDPQAPHGVERRDSSERRLATRAAA